MKKAKFQQSASNSGVFFYSVYIFKGQYPVLFFFSISTSQKNKILHLSLQIGSYHKASLQKKILVIFNW